MQLGLQGRSVLVTGSYRGTGRVIADRFCTEGAHVFYHALDEDGVTQLSSAQGSIVKGDITTDEGADQVFRQVLAEVPELHVLVNNYGKGARGNWSSADPEAWVETYQVNTLSAVRMIQRFSGVMPAGGRIVNIGTIGSSRPNRIMPHYYAAKGALANLTVSLAKELGPRGITVNLVSPGLIRTPEVEAMYLREAEKEGWGSDFETAEAEITRRHFPNPLGRIATREEVADVVLFLAGVPASFVNGQNLRVDGGAVDTT